MHPTLVILHIALAAILTGSSDGLLRVVQLFPTKLVGAIADHGEFPIERIAVDMDGEGRWVGSVGHDEALHLTDLQEVLEDDEEEDEEKDEETVEEDKTTTSVDVGKPESSDEENEGPSSSEGEDGKQSAVKSGPNDDNKKRKPKQQDPLGADNRKKKKKGKGEEGCRSGRNILLGTIKLRSPPLLRSVCYILVELRGKVITCISINLITSFSELLAATPSPTARILVHPCMAVVPSERSYP